MRERSIGFRLTVWYALILSAGMGLFSALLWLSLRQRLLSDADRDLSDRAARFQSYMARESAEAAGENLKDELEEFCQGLPSADYLEVIGASGFEFHFPNRLPAAGGRMRTFRRQFSLGRDSFQLQIGASLRDVDHTLDLLRFLLLGLTPVVIAIACAGGAWLSRRALRPVDEITRAARTIGIDNLSLRLSAPKTGDELERLTQAWNVMLARLEEAVGTLSRFAADASHELRTPLAVMRTSAELALRRARSPESYRQSLQEIAGEAERMTRIVEDLLALARSDAHSSEMPREPLDPAGLLQEVAAELRGIADTRGILIRMTEASPRDNAAAISGNRSALRRLFLVLLDNAIKYSRPASEVWMEISSSQETVAVTIRDFGIGIGEADLPHIFQRFYQADRARTDGGFGLGLSLAKSIARAHGASIEVESKEGSGSKFRVLFPAPKYASGGTHPAQTRDPLLSAPR